MRVVALLAVLLVAASTASAEGLAPYESIQKPPPSPDRTFAIAINEPFGWSSGFAIAGSIYGRVAAHHAVRINVADYEYNANEAGDLISIASGGDGSEIGHYGRLLDVGAGWMYFPRRVFDGPTVEVGFLHRSIDTSTWDDFGSPEKVWRDGQEVAARALLGWSWMIRNRVFIAMAFGASKGYAYGRETTQESTLPASAKMTHDFGEWTTGFEGYLRFGVAFGE